MKYDVVRRGRLYALTCAIHGAAKLTGGRGLLPVYRTLLPAGKHSDRTIVRLGPDSTFAYPALDYYWDYYIKGGRPYEPEILHTLRRLRHLKYRFVDCGANFGYWSIMASSSALGGQSAVAVEASASTFAVLTLNAGLNGHRFRVLNRAIYRRSGELVSLGGEQHAGRSIMDGPGEMVETTTVDEVAQAWAGNVLPVVCKLDVEGAEIDALAGARLTLAGDSAFLYENHGKDPTCVNTEAFLASGSEVFQLTPSAIIGPIRTVGAVRRIKLNRFRGYNFLALSPGARVLREAMLG
jgi:FkbM family methyltransferase